MERKGKIFDKIKEKKCNREYKGKIIEYIFILLDNLLSKGKFVKLKSELQTSINNGSLEINLLATHFYKYVSDYLLKNLEKVFVKGYNFQIHFRIFGSTNFFYDDTFQFSPEDIIFFSRTIEELNFMCLNVKLTAQDAEILVKANKHRDDIWREKNTVFYKYAGNQDIISFTLKDPNLVDENFTSSSFITSKTDATQPKVYDHFNNLNLQKRLPVTGLLAKPNSCQVFAHRIGVHVSKVSPSFLNYQLINPLKINSARVKLPFSFGYGGNSNELYSLTISPNGFVIAYYRTKYNMKKYSDRLFLSRITFFPGGFVSGTGIFKLMKSVINFITIDYRYKNNSIQGFSTILCNTPSIRRGLPSSLVTKSSSTGAGIQVVNTAIDDSLNYVNYPFNISGNNSSNQVTTIAATNVYTIYGDSTIGADELTNVIAWTGGSHGSTINYLIIGAGACGGIYLNSTEHSTNGVYYQPGLPYKSGTCEPGGSAGGCVYGSIGVPAFTLVTLSFLIGSGGFYYGVLSSDDSGNQIPSGVGLTENNPTGVVQGNVSSTTNNQAGASVSYEEGMQGTCSQIGIIDNQSLETYSIDGYINAYGGQPGCVALVGQGSDISLWQTNNNANINCTIWGPSFYYNSEFGSGGTDTEYTFTTTSGSYSPGSIVTINTPQAYSYINNGASGGFINYYGTNINGDTGFAGGYWQSGLAPITSSPNLLFDSPPIIYVSEIPGQSGTIPYDYLLPFGGGGGSGGNYTGTNNDYTKNTAVNGSQTSPYGVSIYGGGQGIYAYSSSDYVIPIPPNDLPSNATAPGGGGGGACAEPLNISAEYQNNVYYTCGFGGDGVIIVYW